MIFLALLLAVLNVSTALSVAGLGEGEKVLSVVKRDCELDFYSFFRVIYVYRILLTDHSWTTLQTTAF